jgi:hypothetical protein
MPQAKAAWTHGLHRSGVQWLGPWSAVIVSAGLLLLLRPPATDVPVVLLVPALILSIARDEGAVACVLGSKPVHWLGCCPTRSTCCTRSPSR